MPYYLRYLLLFLLIFATVKAFREFKNLTLYEKKSFWGWLGLLGQFLIPALFLLMDISVIKGFRTDEKGIHLAAPLREGFILHGGSSVLINYHHADPTAQQYAMDIIKLNALGIRASGFFPKALDKYAIYGDTVFSPCEAKVVRVKDGLDDLPPGYGDTVNLAGNHIVLEFQNHLIVLAHLMKNSILVTPGDSVREGQPLARVGNSGHTTEPHLHIHAVEGTDTANILKGNGIPIYFNGRFLVRNDRIRKQK